VLVHGDEIVVGIAKERITRRKRDGCARNNFDDATISYCLDAAGITLEDVSLIVQNSIFTFLCDADYYATLGLYPRSVGITPRRIDVGAPNVRLISHHLAHAYSAAVPSPFADAAVLVADAMGNEDAAIRDFFEGEDREWMREQGVGPYGGWERESCYLWREETLRPIWKRLARNDAPYEGEIQGLGILYHTVSEYIFGDGHEAGQTMGLAPFGDPRRFDDIQMVSLLDERPYLHFHQDWRRRFTRAWQPGDEAPHLLENRERVDLAAKVQDELERALVHLARKVHAETGAANLCFSGGVALNCVANAKILEETPFQALFVPPAAGDTGIALGCAMYGYRLTGGDAARIRYKNDFLGRSYDETVIRRAIAQHGLSSKYLPDPAAEAARWIAQGAILGWFQGGAEFGPRSLGHRSIFCSPAPALMRETLNARVKHRAGFRPFAPSVLAEKAAEYFELDGDSPYMLRVAPVRASKLQQLAAVAHVDGTARVQTVTRESDPLYHDLIAHHERLTGVPVVLNTSFNDAGEPIVETPEDALQCFLRTEMDALIVGRYLVLHPRRQP
jgi:carbamoyltransferase